jgi:hypothetical protein
LVPSYNVLFSTHSYTPSTYACVVCIDSAMAHSLANSAFMKFESGGTELIRVTLQKGITSMRHFDIKSDTIYLVTAGSGIVRCELHDDYDENNYHDSATSFKTAVKAGDVFILQNGVDIEIEAWTNLVYLIIKPERGTVDHFGVFTDSLEMLHVYPSVGHDPIENPGALESSALGLANRPLRRRERSEDTTIDDYGFFKRISTQRDNIVRLEATTVVYVVSGSIRIESHFERVRVDGGHAYIIQSRADVFLESERAVYLAF